MNLDGYVLANPLEISNSVTMHSSFVAVILVLSAIKLVSLSYVTMSNKVWDFLPKNPTKKSAKYLLSDNMAALVRHNQTLKCLQINSKPLH